MIPRHGSVWDGSARAPSPELLAAYFDGEFEGRDDLAPLRRRLEDWLAGHPAAQTELADYHRLRQLWQETAPPDITLGSWQEVLARVEREAAAGPLPVSSSSGRPWPATALVAAAAGVVLAAFLILPRIHQQPVQKALAEDDIFPVASEREVVILHVEGADTGSVVVGQLPLQGPLELAGPGDVTLTSVQPAARDNMVPQIVAGGQGRPIIWARAETEDD